MEPFLSENFLLNTPTAQKLYHDYAKQMPIIDYHNHLPPDEIATDKKFDNITQIWLNGDHYKWRAMRTNGIDEKYITGPASDWEKFEKWAETVPYTARNPLFHWTHMELKYPFGIQEILKPSSAKAIYDQTRAAFAKPEFSVRGLLSQFNVKVVCTTDDPIDSLEHHKAAAAAQTDLKVLPTWRPDKAMAVENPTAYNQYIDKLSAVADVEIKNFADLLQALQKRQDHFEAHGCRLSDHGLETMYATPFTDDSADALFKKVRLGTQLTPAEIDELKSAILYHLAIMDHAKGWTQQFHLGALRNNNDRMLRELGPDTGFDSIGDFTMARAMSNFFNKLDSTDQLAKTIIYNLNPRDNDLFATMIGNYQDGSVVGKMQFGSGWWFLDQKSGMIDQMNSLSNMGLLSRFVGMLTDSRSFLSFSRHEYFRRILCQLIGTDVENGELPNDLDWLGGMVQDVCYNNANQYFGF